MAACCPHRPDEHQLLATCQQVIHYPSEDYPCLCHGFEGDADLCLGCDHARRDHLLTRVCTACACAEPRQNAPGVPRNAGVLAG